MHLLATLGSSFGVVPEAFLLGNGPEQYARVTVLATSGVPDSVRQVREWFAGHAPQVALSLRVIADLPDIRNHGDHARFEEALLRCYAAVLRQEESLEKIHLCLAGGFKTISSAVHQTADLLGCGKLFHITSPFGHRFDTDAEFRQGIAEGLINLIDLGPRPGWPTIQTLLDEAPAPQGETLRIENITLREQVQNRLQEANRLAQSERELAALPFPQIARWSPAARDWLNQPLDPNADADWVRGLPKVELHCHLGGFATHGALLAEVRAAARHPERLPPLPEPDSEADRKTSPPADWPCPAEPIGLEPYRHLGDLNGSALLRDPGCLRKQIELLYHHFAAENIQHAEVRCSPGNYASPGRSPWKVLEEILTGFEEVAASFPACSPVAASFPACSPVSPPVPGAGEAATFIPYNEDKDYSQTWRDLPHRHQEGATAFVTFRLADSLPKDRVKSWLAERELFLAKHPKPWSEEIWRNYQRRFPRQLENWLDRSHGSCLLRNPENAALVAQALQHFDGERYILDRFVVMPNHVHALVKPLGSHKLADILHSWKSFTAKAINERENRAGQLWQHESYDHLVRSERQLEHYRHYIAENPEKAGLEQGYLVGQGLGLVVGASTPACPEVGTSFPACPEVTPAVPDAGHSLPSETLAATSEPSQRLAPTINLIIIGTRQPGGDYRTQIIKHLMLAVTAAEHFGESRSCRVVGVDLAGFEDPSTRSHYFRDDFLPVHRAGLSLTVHAGENDDAEAIWSAIFDLSAMRLGHGLSLHESPALLRSVAQRRIAIEMCPYANLQIKGYPLDKAVDLAPEEKRYPLLRYLRAGVPVTVNTDNIGISAASLSDNLLLLPRLCPGLTRLDVLHLLRHAIEHSFLPQEERERLLGQIHLSHQ
ncbi:transposase [Roseibacillus ishigakijimensis]|uniref:adenosine deaminase n=1 Tax=Roseibacillus ishigakijimensis TaxID=454146 RepID=A0A934RJE8_9BACT|nr:transposase [Roseibacillus ishigakijimensis]MBK1832762.1 transposase [Roseibacillus ishigakijimensis]